MNALTDYDKAEFVRDREGARRAGMSIGTFRRVADDLQCVYFVGRSRLTKWDDFVKRMEKYKA